MAQKDKYRYRQGEVKTSILELILSNRGILIGESYIREGLEKKYGDIAQPTVNRHLRELLDMGCVEFIPPSKKGLRNFWNIQKIKQLKQINDSFPGIKLVKFQKTLDVIALERKHQDSSFDWASLHGNMFEVMLCLSNQFFTRCLETDFKSLYAKGFKIFLCGDGFGWYKEIQKDFNDIRVEFWKRISKASSIQDIGMTDEAFFTLITEEKFQKMWEDIPFKHEFPLYDDGDKNVIAHRLRLIKGVSQKISREIFPEESKEKSDELYQKLTEENREALFKKIEGIKFHLALWHEIGIITIFKHCFESDVLEENTSDLEEKFVLELESKRFEHFKNYQDKEEIRNYPEIAFPLLYDDVEKYLEKCMEANE